MREESERAIRERIDATRARMGDTVEEIGDRVNPDRLQRELKERAREQVDEFKHTAKQKAREKMRDVEHGMADTGRGVWDTIKENPIPAGMVGVGLAWLMANGRSRGEDRHDRELRSYRSAGGYRDYATYSEAGPAGFGAGYSPPAGGFQSRGMESTAPIHESYERGLREGGEESGEGRAGQAADRVRHEADRVRHQAEDMAESVRDKGDQLAHRASDELEQVRHRAEHWGEEAQERVRRAEHRVEDAVRENPMAAGAVAAALGFAAGMMIPETRKEHEMMGPTRDRLLDRAQDTARRAGEKAKEVARETASASAEGAVDEVWSSGDDDSEAQSPMTGPGR